MANNCFYHLKIVGKNRENVQQFADALKYQDLKNGYHLNRIFDACQDDVIRDGEYFVTDVTGMCAWSVFLCMFDKQYAEWRGGHYLEPKFHVWRDFRGRICFANLLVSVPILCKILDCGVEIWSSENGMEFQEHYIVNSSGDIVENETIDWHEAYEEGADGEWIRKPENDTGGFENFETFQSPTDIFNATET